MKILHVVPSYKPAYVYGGPIESVARLCETLVTIGNDVRVFTTTANGSTELRVQVGVPTLVDGVQVTYFKRVTKDPTHISFQLWKQLYKTCREYDIVHIHSWWNILVIVAAAICHWRGTRVVVSPRGMLSNYILNNSHSVFKRLIHRSLGKRALRKAVFHATAQAEYIECLKVIPKWKGFVLPNILQLPIEPLHRTKNKVFTLIYLSRIHPKKGLEYLFDTLSKIQTPILVKIAGDGDDSYIQFLKQKAANINIAEKIEWIGWQSRENKFNKLAQADLFILPSFNENFANTVVEALAVGTPVLITPHVGLADYVQKNNLGWVSELNVESLAATINMAIADEDRRNYVSSYGRDIVLSTFSAISVAEKYVEQYQQSFKLVDNYSNVSLDV